MKSDFWTDRRTAILTSMWNADKTAALIADALHCTRDMVIGKAHRLGLPSRPSPIIGDPEAVERHRRAALESNARRKWKAVNERRDALGLPHLPRQP